MLGGFAVRGPALESWMTYFTFREASVVENDQLFAKAIDPRATAWAAVEAARELSVPELGLVCCYAEECSPIAAQKGGGGPAGRADGGKLAPVAQRGSFHTHELPRLTAGAKPVTSGA